MIKKNSIKIKILNESDVSENYCRWMNDKHILKYTSQFGVKHSLRSIKKFVKEKKNQNLSFYMGYTYKIRKLEVMNTLEISSLDQLILEI